MVRHQYDLVLVKNLPALKPVKFRYGRGSSYIIAQYHIEQMVFESAATGDGPLDAACRAIDKITDIYGKMHEFKLNAVSGGKDALGEAIANIEICGKMYSGRGLSTDIIEASVKSYLNAINKHYYEQQLAANKEV